MKNKERIETSQSWYDSSFPDFEKAIPRGIHQIEEERSQAAQNMGVEHFLPEVLTKHIEQKMNTFFENADFYISVYRSSLVDVIEKGRFMSQFESGESNGLYNPSVRVALEASTFGWDKEHVKKSAIYGYCDTAEGGHTNTDSYSIVWQYGDIAFKLKKAHLKNRTTFVVGDSLSAVRKKQAFPSLVAQPSIASIPPIVLNSLASELVDNLSSEKNNNEDTLLGYGNDYVEAQYLGGVSLEDVETIYLPQNMSLEERGAVKKLLEKNGYDDISVIVLE